MRSATNANRHVEPDAPAPPAQILRFHSSERMLHWALAIPFILCGSTALVLAGFYNLHPRWAFRGIFAWTHRISGACLILFPLLTAIRYWRHHHLHWRNIREAWTWSVDDLKWLVLMSLAAITGNDDLPEQGKFNAAEKLNFMMQMVGYPILAVTGLILWSSKIAFLSWLIHIGMASLAAPLVLGHLYMAIINRSTRVGLSGMLSGYVDREWARHHYPLWYREHFEQDRHKPARTRSRKPLSHAPGVYCIDDSKKTSIAAALIVHKITRDNDCC